MSGWKVFCFFFFSSRRRHTRFDCDWSSDVCSSDLVERRFHLGGTFVCHQAITSGQIDLYVEYTGTAYTAVLKRSEEHTSELQSQSNLVCRLLLEKKKKTQTTT